MRHSSLKGFALFLVISTLFAVEGLNAAVITDFTTANFFLIDDETTFDQVTQNTQGIVASSSSLLYDQFAGIFTPVTITGLETITLTGSLALPQPDLTFSITLYDETLTHTRTYFGSTTGWGTTPSTIILEFFSETAAFTTIGGLSFSFQEITAIPIAISLHQLEAIPEPSLLIPAFVLGGMALLWQRRKQGGILPGAKDSFGSF